MTRRRFIADSTNGIHASLLGDQAAHLARVLRAQVGQQFDVVANGFLHRATVSFVSDGEVIFDLGEELESDAPLPVHVLFSVIKFDHYEWGVEKLTELGVERITPVLARRTEKHLAAAAAKRVERWRRIALEASKQSRRAVVPTVDEPVGLGLALAAVDAPHRLLLAETEREISLRAALDAAFGKDKGPDAERNRALAMAFGPEGGWAPEEMAQILTAGFAAVTLGPRILRAETAAIAALSVVAAWI